MKAKFEIGHFINHIKTPDNLLQITDIENDEEGEYYLCYIDKGFSGSYTHVYLKNQDNYEYTYPD